MKRSKPLARRTALSHGDATLARRTPLQNRTPLASPGRLSASGDPKRMVGKVRPSAPAKRRRKRRPEPGELEWKEPRSGRCAVCGTRGPLVRHHILTEQRIRVTATPEQIAAGVVWIQANALDVGAPVPWGGQCTCHGDHHSAKRRIPYSLVSAAALSFAHDLLGDGAWVEYFRRYYEAA